MGYSPWGCKESDTTEATECTHTNAYLMHLAKTNYCELKSY